MKKVLLTLLAVVVVLGVIGAAGFTGYRFGYAQGIQATVGGQIPNLRLFDGRPGRALRDNFGMDRGFERGFGMRGVPMMGFGFSLFRFVTQLAVLALVIWFAYWLFTRSGWRLTRQTAPTAQTAQTTETTESAPPTTDNE